LRIGRGFALARAAFAVRRVARPRPAVEFEVVGVRGRNDLEGLLAQLALQLCDAVLDAARRPRHVLARLKDAEFREPVLDHRLQGGAGGLEGFDRPDEGQPLEGVQGPRQFGAAIGRPGHRQPVRVEIAAGAVAGNGQARPQIAGEIVLPREARPFGFHRLIALEEVSGLQPVERVADEQDRQDLGIRDVRRRQGQRVRRQGDDVRVGGKEAARRIGGRSRRVFARRPARAEIALQDGVDAGAGVLEQMIVNNDRAPRRIRANSGS
jgi:hypothetical protein